METTTNKTAKELIEQLYAMFHQELQTKQPFKDGDVVEKEGRILKITNLAKGEAYGLDINGKWAIMSGWTFKDYPDNWQLSTPEKWLEVCKNEAVKRGFKEGVTIDKTNLNYEGEKIWTLISDIIYMGNDYMQIGSDYIMRNGIWAEVIKADKTLDELDKDWRSSDVHYSHDYIKLHPEAYIKAIQNLNK